MYGLQTFTKLKFSINFTTRPSIALCPPAPCLTTNSYFHPLSFSHCFQPCCLHLSSKFTFYYLLPQINNPKTLGGPIISTHNYPTKIISKYLDCVLTPLVASLPSHIHGINHALLLSCPFFTPVHSVFGDPTQQKPSCTKTLP